MKKSKLIFLPLLVFLLIPCNYIEAKKPEATLTSVKDKVMLQRSGETSWQRASSGTTLFTGDGIQTYKGSSAVIIFADKTRVKVSEKSILRIKVVRKRVKPEEKPSLVDIKMKVGRVWVRVKKVISPTSTFEVETPSALVGVRSTLLSLGVREDGGTVVSVKEGVVEIFGETSSVLVEEGKEAEIEIEKMEPEPPKAMSPEEGKRWEKEKEWVESVTKEEVKEEKPKEEVKEEKPKEEVKEEEKPKEEIKEEVKPPAEEEVKPPAEGIELPPPSEEKEPAVEETPDVEEETPEIGWGAAGDKVSGDEIINEVEIEEEVIEPKPEDEVEEGEVLNEIGTEEETIE